MATPTSSFSPTTIQSASSSTSQALPLPTVRSLLSSVSPLLTLEYDSVKLMDNSGPFISIWIFLLFFVLVLLISRKICRCQCCFRSSSRLLRCVIWGPILRTFLITSLELGFCAYINVALVSPSLITQISFQSVPDSISSALSILVLLTLCLLPFIILHILSPPLTTLQSPLYRNKFG